MTNDYNLNRVAHVEGVAVLNINELANAVKTVLLPGEELRVAVIREGRETHQGVGYLDDGTMIVIENGRRLIGETVDVAVTRELQTNAGRMIFAASRSCAHELGRGHRRGRPRHAFRPAQAARRAGRQTDGGMVGRRVRVDARDRGAGGRHRERPARTDGGAG